MKTSAIAPRQSTASIVLAFAGDIACVALFAAIGRDTHEHGLDVPGILLTAAPFAGGAAIGWLLGRAWRRPLALWPAAVVVWLSAVVFGLVLRGLAGGGLAVSFQIVTLLVLGAFIVGWRLVAALVMKIRKSRTVA
ncbi:DUF3054 domain-containing protein [Crystallibacter degradans]|uniref:DUF3054 domain-containing protein n=1 Tax=Crystallibacter degradans TaxID=2726743 RepID=UPI003211F74D